MRVKEYDGSGGDDAIGQFEDSLGRKEAHGDGEIENEEPSKAWAVLDASSSDDSKEEMWKKPYQASVSLPVVL